MNRKRQWLGVILMGVAVSFSGCAKKSEAPVTVGTWKLQQTIQPYLYGRYLPASMPCEVKPFTNPGDMKTALLAGSLDICGTTLVQAILSGSRGEPVVLVAGLCNKCSALVVRTEGGIQSEADLKGKRIGYVPSTMHHILLLSLLRKAGLRASDVTLVRVDFFDMLNALQHGQIDAFLSGEPFPSRAVASGVGRVLAYPYFDDSIGTLNAGLLVRRDLLNQSPEKVRALVKAHVEATTYLEAHLEEWLQLAVGLGNDEAILRQAARNIDLCWDMDATFIAQVKRLGAEMLELGMIERLPDWDSLLCTRYVDELRQSTK
jgi:NitT/TauT family transport system substrate-binding protein